MSNSEIHALQFPKKKFNISKILKWLEDNDFKANLIENKPNYFWINITSKKKYKSFSAKKLDNGIIMVFGWLDK